jgi:hypothetical protein
MDPVRARLTSGIDEHAMQVVECTIPAHMTIDQWRRQDRTADCDHLHETTTRYDRQARRLEFFLFCPVCRTARVVHSVDYEPRFEPIVARVHALPRREAPRPERRAA